MKRSLFLSLPALALVASIACANDPHAGHGGHDHGAHDHAGHDHTDAPKADTNSDAVKAFEAVNAKMHADMNAALTGDPDVDFMRGMIPHHQGAIDMAEIVLKYGKDPEARTLAEEIIKAQTGEIALMKEWLAKRGL